MFRDGPQRVFIYSLSFRATQMRRENHSRTLLDRVADRRQRSADARVVLDLPVLDWDVEINSDENVPGAEIEIFDGELVHCQLPIADCQFALAVSQSSVCALRLSQSEMGNRQLAMSRVPCARCT